MHERVLRARRHARGAVDRRRTTSAVSRAMRSSNTCRTSAVTKVRRRSGSSTTSKRNSRRRAWVAYIGDDITDEDAFRAIECGIGVLVGLRPTAATHKLDGIADVDRFLRWLATEGNVGRTRMTSAQLESHDRRLASRHAADRRREPRAVHPHPPRVDRRAASGTGCAASKETRRHRVDATGERSGHRARSGDARVRRHVDRARQRQRRSRNRRMRAAACRVPPDRPSYTLRRVWLTPEEEQGYYYGCANNALWPLCHIAYARPRIRRGRLAAIRAASTADSPMR